MRLEHHQVLARLSGHHQSVIQRHFLRSTSSLQVVPGTGEIDQNSPHQLRGDGEEVGTVLPAHLLDINQPQVRLVN